jgi:hypothetical protein
MEDDHEWGENKDFKRGGHSLFGDTVQEFT